MFLLFESEDSNFEFLEKVKKMMEAAEQKKKIDERLKAIKEQQEMELEKRRQEKAKRDEQERKLNALNRIIEEDAAKKSKLVRSQDPEAEAKRNMAHYRMQDVKKQLEVGLRFSLFGNYVLIRRFLSSCIVLLKNE